MRQALESRADANGFIELPDFVETALYAPGIGYYTSERARVGRRRDTDFYTASSLREAFAAIVAEAAAGLCQQLGIDPAQTDWVEIGAEPDAALLGDAPRGFRQATALRVGEPLELQGQLVVFSNELFDAQPFRQIRFTDGRWREFGIQLQGDRVDWTQREATHPECGPWLARLPSEAIPGYTIDLPTGSLALASNLLAQDWSGVFIAFDYGKTWFGLTEETPQGSARSYRSHQMTNDILDRPGEQDITHHICWDDLERALTGHGFDAISLQSQESFIARRAPGFLQTVFDPSRTALDPLRGMLKELMHPALMGQKFQALSGIRSSTRKRAV